MGELSTTTTVLSGNVRSFRVFECLYPKTRSLLVLADWYDVTENELELGRAIIWDSIVASNVSYWRCMLSGLLPVTWVIICSLDLFLLHRPPGILSRERVIISYLGQYLVPRLTYVTWVIICYLGCYHGSITTAPLPGPRVQHTPMTGNISNIAMMMPVFEGFTFRGQNCAVVVYRFKI